MDDHLAGAAVQRTDRPLRHLEHLRAGHHDRRDPKGAGDDRGVALGGAAGGHQTQQQFAVDRDQLAGQQLIRNQHTGAVKGDLLPRAPVEDVHHPAAGVLNVSRPLREVFVGQAADLGGVQALRPLHRVRGAGTRLDIAQHLVLQAVVVEHFNLKGEDRLIALGGHLAELCDLVLGQHQSGFEQGGLPRGLEHDPPQRGAAAGDDPHRAERQPRAGRGAGNLLHRQLCRCGLFGGICTGGRTGVLHRCARCQILSVNPLTPLLAAVSSIVA